MRYLLLVIVGCVAGHLTFAQTGKGSVPAERYKKPTAANLPEGTYAKDNKVYIKPGYKGVYDANGKTVTIARINNGGGGAASAVGGKFKCSCGSGGGYIDDCKATIGNGTLTCAAEKGTCTKCQLEVVVGLAPKVAAFLNDPENSSMNWKSVEVPRMKQ